MLDGHESIMNSFPRAHGGVISDTAVWAARSGSTESLPPSFPDVSSQPLPSLTARIAGQDILKQIDAK